MSLRIGYVSSDPGIPLDGTKGASVHFRELGKALLRAGCDVRAVVARGARGRFTSFNARATDAPRSADPVARELMQLTQQAATCAELDRSGPYDLIYERYSLFGLAGLTYARHHGLPFYLEVNAPLWEEAERYRNLALPRLARAVAADLCAHATKVLVVSTGLRDLLVREGVPAQRIRLFPNGVAPDFLSEEASVPKPEPFRGRPTLLFVGSLKPWHGVDFLLQAFLAHRGPSGACLWIVGDGPLASHIDRVAQEHPGDIVRTPAVAHEQVPAVLRAADIVVAPYTSDSPGYFCPLKVVEALAVGTPVLASDVPAVRGLDLGGARIGWFAPGHVGSFGQALEGVLGDLEGERTRSREVNRSIVRERFTWDGRARDLIQMAGDQPAPASPPGRAASSAVGALA